MTITITDPRDELALTGSRAQRQRRVSEWAQEAFGVAQATGLPQRGIRLLEEAIEAYQACGGARDKALELVNFVFDRDVGEVGQELGGVAICVLALAAAAGLDADDEELRELKRILSKPLEHYTKRNAAKNAAGFLVVEDAASSPVATATSESTLAPEHAAILAEWVKGIAQFQSQINRGDEDRRLPEIIAAFEAYFEVCKSKLGHDRVPIGTYETYQFAVEREAVIHVDPARDFRKWLVSLATDEQRQHALAVARDGICVDCGCVTNGCQCTNDE